MASSNGSRHQRRTRTDDIDAAVKAVARAERNSFLGTELSRTSGLGLDSRQGIVGTVGISMSHRGREVIGEMARECANDEERAIALDYAVVFHERSVQAYDAFARKTYER
ncbi:hypothetical protein G6024_01030 [Dietzia maris]|nr:hypothetical protein [Dietzia maris]MBB0995705.1 hypothetical protein [Dietzia maris]